MTSSVTETSVGSEPALYGSSLIDATVTVRLAELDAAPSVTWKLMMRLPVFGLSLEFWYVMLRSADS
jgi:hypothetical protein